MVGYEKFSLEFELIDNIIIQIHMKVLKKIADNPLEYLAKINKTKIKSNKTKK